MSREMLDYYDFNHDEYARSRPRDDFWGQIRRTVKGNSVDEEQIKLIVDTVKRELQLDSSDKVLDLCCGNGALSSRFIKYVSKLTGIDNSEYLVSVAKEFFETSPVLMFHKSEISKYMHDIPKVDAMQITKVLCYGSFSYLDMQTVGSIFYYLNIKFTNVSHFYIGNVPDKSKTDAFFVQKKPINLNLSSHTTTIGRWWDKAEVIDLATENMWSTSILSMPNHFFSSSYRFDALLRRNPQTH